MILRQKYEVSDARRHLGRKDRSSDIYMIDHTKLAFKLVKILTVETEHTWNQPMNLQTNHTLYMHHLWVNQFHLLFRPKPRRIKPHSKKKKDYATTVDRTLDKVPISDQNQRHREHLLPAELDQEGLSNHIII